jgi:Bacterial Ig domain
MRTNDFTFKATLRALVGMASILFLTAALGFGQQEVNLSADPSSLTLPDGSMVPMWGYTCGAVVNGSTATCAKLNLPATGWSPVIITVPTGETLKINLTNNLSFVGGTNKIPTSLVIVGQLGGGLGDTPVTTPSPTHPDQTLTWPVSSSSLSDGRNMPPTQGPRVRSFSTEVTVGTPASLTWAGLQPGTYLLESGTHPSIQGPMGLYGMVVVADAASAGSPGIAYPAMGGNPAVTYDADVPLLFSEIDPVQNQTVSAAVMTSGFSATMVWSGQPGGCGNPTSPTYHRCYPPAVDYSPLYYLINGLGFDKTNSSASLFPTSPASGLAATGKILVRLVNAGLRMHVPSIVGSFTGNPAVGGFSLIAEDGNPHPGLPRVQDEVFMAAGKTFDVMINVPSGATALPIYDRELSLSGNATERDAGMLAYIGTNGSGLPSAGSLAAAVANPDTYNSVIHCTAAPCKPVIVSDPSKGVIANDINVYGVAVSTLPTKGTLTLNANGTFTYIPNVGTSSDSFVYRANGTGPTATVTLGGATVETGSGIHVNPDSYTSNVATMLTIMSPGVLANDTDTAGYPLTVPITGPNAPVPSGNLTLTMDSTGAFKATVNHSGMYTFTYHAQNSQGTVSSTTATVTLNFPSATGLAVILVDGITKATLPKDYRWIIEEDRTFFVDKNCQTNPLPAGCPTVTPAGTPAIFGTNFHTSYMPVVAQGCVGSISCESGQTFLNPGTGTHVNAVCDVGDGACRPGGSKTALDPSQVYLDPTKHYYISVLPGDAGDAEHAMGGAQIAPGQTSVQVICEPQNQQPAKLSVFVFEDDHPLNGEHDASGGIGTLAPNEPGLGGFNITILDLVGGTGDAVGQMTYDEFNQPLSNALAGTIDPVTHQDACPISKDARKGFDTGGSGNPGATSDTGITGVIPVCPKYEVDHTTLSPLAGQAIVTGMPPGRYGVVATPAADRIARGEEWLQTNTLDGGKDLESFLRINEPQYFQEFGPGSFHVSIGFANPRWIDDVGTELCKATTCSQTVKGHVTGVHMSRPSDERLYGTGTNDTFGYTQCYASLGSPDGADITFAKCDDNGNFSLPNVPEGDWRVTIFDQWNDEIVDGISTPVRVGTGTNGTLCPGSNSNGPVCDMGEVAVHAWKNNLYTRTFHDENGDGISNNDEQGLTFVATNIRFRDGSFSNFNSTDLEGNAGFNEVFPLFNWYVLETDSTRYKNTGTHVVNDSGGPVDNSANCGVAGYPACGDSDLLANLGRTHEDFSVPASLRVPGAYYCDHADCTGHSIANGPGGPGGSTGRIDPPWVTSYGWQSFAGQNQYLEFGKKPFAVGENGGIRGHVIYASTRPFDDPALELQTSWEPLVPHVTINLYQEGTAPDGSPSLKLVDTTTTTSWDDWAQGFRSDGKPNMNCPGQDPSDLFFFTLQNQPNYLDWYNHQHGGAAVTSLPNNSQYKCYDGLHNWNQLQPAPYDGMYRFPSVASRSTTTGKPLTTNCTVCVPNPSTGWDAGLPMLPAGKYVVEINVPRGYELVKEEDKNILLGDAYEAPVTQEFLGFGNIFIIPDQAAVAATYNANNPLIPNTDLGALPRHEGDTGSVESFWPCVGKMRIVPDFMSLFPQSGQNAPFAGATRPLCDRKEVTLSDQMSALAKFYIFTSTHVAGHYTGIITDDFTSEFNPFSPAFGEKSSPPNLPVSVKDWAGNEISRVYSDQFGTYNGLNYSTFSVNPPDPSGYIPTMMVMCMNDRGAGTTSDAFYQPVYSQFCYELPFMPGQTGYFDTPVIPTSAFAPDYNHPDCNYPDATPAISYVDEPQGQAGVGPWVPSAGAKMRIYPLGDQQVNNYAYSGPSATTAPYNQKTITRHYGFGMQCNNPKPGQPTCTTLSSVTIGGVPAKIDGWTENQIQITVPSGVPNCPVQQQVQYGGSTAQCGELVITAGNGKKSVDAVTITIGGKAPTMVSPGPGAIQAAIDAAKPGDLILVPPGYYHELLIMWKPVRLQGEGAVGTIIDANAHPAGVLNDWRRRVVCLFGLAPNGVPEGYSPSCGKGWAYFQPTSSNPQIDRLPLEATVGWDATLNGNLAEQLQEPTLMGAYEGAGITVLSKGVRFPNGSNPFASDVFPTGTVFLTNSNNSLTTDPNGCGPNTSTAHNPFPSNFLCNPSSIDGLSITNSSQGGGGILVHGWGHYLQIANNRVYNNQGTLAGGISIGQGEHPGAYTQGAANPDPGSCQSSGVPNTQLPYCFDRFVNVHNNDVLLNASEGDELFSATPSGAGGVAFCTGADNYMFNYNWVCGNLSTGDGSGVSQVGFVWNGSIQHNSILFNQSTNPTTPSNGGGLLIMSAPDTDPVCPGEPDADCSHAYGTVGDGIGPGLVVNGNLILGNAAEAGSGGGVRFQGVNGVEVSTFPNNPERWYTVNATNNIIANNVAGWDGGGVSLQDSIGVNLINDTIVSNDSTASSGTLFGAYFATQSSAPTPCGRDVIGANVLCVPASTPQPAGLSSAEHSAEFLASLTTTITCPQGHPNCAKTSYPILYNDVLWQNRAFHIDVVQPASGSGSQQSTVTLVPQLNQGSTGACVTPTDPTTYWDIGLRGDLGPTDHSSGFAFDPEASVLTSISGYPGADAPGFGPNTATFSPGAIQQYCNGAKIPPEAGKSAWYQVPPGTNEGNVPVPIFSLTAGATVDEGNNWINITWGPLSLVNPNTETNPSTETPLGNYGLASGSPAINYITSANSSTTYAAAPGDDFYGNARKLDAGVDVGAVEFGAAPPPATLTSIVPNSSTPAQRNHTVSVTIIGTNFTPGSTVAVAGSGITSVSNVVVVDTGHITADFSISNGSDTGPQSVTVTNNTGTPSNALVFTKN